MEYRKLFTAAALFCISLACMAVPAKPGNIVKVQPDGSRIVVRLHGDEFYHWVSDTEGNPLVLDERGFYVRGAKPEQSQDAVARRNMVNAGRVQKRAAASSSMTKGTKYFPVVLVAFKDVPFTVAQTAAAVRSAFSALMNEEGYSQNGCNGSVADYFKDQSGNTFTPVFEVLGPVTMPGNMSSYVTSQSYTTGPARTMIQYACSQLVSSADFSRYDNDGDGAVDMIFMYYAGYNQAEGTAGTIWPHQSSISSSTTYDGKKLSSYACTSELKGTSGTVMCGVGTASHEFGHALGLPDMYDTDYDNYNGEAGGTYMYDVMCMGSYNNDGCTPPYYTAEERVMVGWMGSIPEISALGNTYTLSTVDNNAAYRAASSNSGEYFLFEARSGRGWDSGLEPGLLIYHIDKSQNRVLYSSYSSTTAYNLWNDWASYNAINENGSHPCGYLIPSSDVSSLNFGGSAADIIFPGSSRVTSFVPVDWNEGSIPWYVRDIAYDSAAGQASFVLGTNSKSLVGTVRNTSGEPIAGATVALFSATAVSSAPSRMVSSGPAGAFSIARLANYAPSSDTPLFSATTGSDGSYSIDLSSTSVTAFSVEAAADGYMASSRNVTVGNSVIVKNFVLLGADEEEQYVLRKYGLDGTSKIYGLGLSDDYPDFQVGAGWSANELEAMVGRRIDYLSFCVQQEYLEPLDSTTTYAIIDFGSQRKLTLKVEDPKIGWNTVDLRSRDIHIPDNTVLYAGYGVDNAYSVHAYPYDMLFAYETAVNGGFYYGLWSSSESGWYSYDGGNALIRLSVAPTVPNMDYLGYNYIDNPGSGRYQLGDEFGLRLVTSSSRVPSSVEWYFDDEPVEGDSVLLDEAGTHLVKAVLTLSSGPKTVELTIEVE